jgi:hypothetical protein
LKINLGKYRIILIDEVYYVLECKYKRVPAWKIWTKKRKIYYLMSSEGFSNLGQAVTFIRRELL